MIIPHDEISKRARAIWDREGRPEGHDKEHWLKAEAELREESRLAPGQAQGSNGGDALVQTGSELPPGNGLRKRPSRRAR